MTPPPAALLRTLSLACAGSAGWLAADGSNRAAGRLVEAVRGRPTGPRWAEAATWVQRRRADLVVLAAMVVTARAGVVAVVALGVLAVSWRRRRGAHGRTNARHREEEQAATALVALAAELRAGRSPAAALATAADAAGQATAQVLRRAASTHRLGGDIGSVLRPKQRSSTRVRQAPTRKARRPGSHHEQPADQGLRVLAACWEVGLSGGAGLAHPIEQAAEGLTAAALLRRDVAAQLAGPRATAGLLAALPLLGVGLATGVGASPLQFLLHTPVGVLCLVAGLLLNLAGLWWTDAIVDRAQRRGS